MDDPNLGEIAVVKSVLELQHSVMTNEISSQGAGYIGMCLALDALAPTIPLLRQVVDLVDEIAVNRRHSPWAADVLDDVVESVATGVAYCLASGAGFDIKCECCDSSLILYTDDNPLLREGFELLVYAAHRIAYICDHAEIMVLSEIPRHDIPQDGVGLFIQRVFDAGMDTRFSMLPSGFLEDGRYVSELKTTWELVPQQFRELQNLLSRHDQLRDWRDLQLRDA